MRTALIVFFGLVLPSILSTASSQVGDQIAADSSSISADPSAPSLSYGGTVDGTDTAEFFDAPTPLDLPSHTRLSWSVGDALASDTVGADPSSPLSPEPRSFSSIRPLDLALVRDTVVSPLDSLQMSRWERVWWGRGGLMRRVGLFPTHPDEPLDDLRQVAHVRRRMLRWHQTLGLVTVASMATTVVGGQLAASGHGSGLHRASLPVTIGLYSTTASLALLSPPKPIRLDREGGGIDSITIHRWLAVGHVAGMLITPLLGDNAGRAHYAMGYATFATFSAAMLTVTLLRR